jgi:uncharacterized phage protein gp47/JayE
MPRVQTKRYEQIYAQMIARVVSRSRLADIADTSVWKHVIAAASRQDDEQYYQISLLHQLFSIDTATDDDLDERAKDIQPGVVTRVQATKAYGSVVFSRTGTTGSVVIPIGTKVKTADDVIFTTTESGQITASSTEQIPGHGVGRDSNEVTVIADEVGSQGRVAANTVKKFVTKPAGIDEVTNLTAFTVGGLDKETDDQFRARLKAYIAGLARCNVSAIEAGIIGQQDPATGSTILFARVWEDIVNRGNVILYVDDGTGSAESVVNEWTPLVATYTWPGGSGATAVVTTSDTSEVVVDDWIKLDSDGRWYQISVIVPNTSVTILNPGSETMPSGSTPSSKATDIVTEGLSAGDAALGGETRLYLDYIAIKDALPINIATSARGNLTKDVEYTLDPTSGLVVFDPALVLDEQVVAGYTRYTGLLAFAQKVVDGDPNDRVNYPGFRAAGVMVQVLPPQVLIQNIVAVVTVAEGFDQDTVISEVKQALKDHINGLSISDDVIRAKLFSVIMTVSGVINVDLITPVDDVILLDDQLVRTRDANLDLT